MADKRVILITGVSGYWGGKVAGQLAGQLASQLAGQPGLHVIGMDVEPPKQEVKGLDFIQADVRNPKVAELLAGEKVDTVCHLAFIDSTHPNENAFDTNVIGTMKIFGACCEAGVRKVIFKSSTAVYGACADNSAFLTEEHPLRGSRSSGFTRDLIEIEAFCNGFRLQAPRVNLTILRFPGIIGPTADTPLTRYLKDPLMPVLWGFDPLMQVIHENDVTGALVHAVLNDVPGVFNVAAEGVVPLCKLLRLAGKMPLPVFHLFAYWGSALLGGAGLRGLDNMPFDLDTIRYPWVGDLARMRDEMQFAPQYTAEEALREFAGYQRTRHFKPETGKLEYDAERLRDTIERRKRLRDRRETAQAAADEQDRTEMWEEM